MSSATQEKTSFDEKNVVVEAVAYEARDNTEVAIASEYTPEQYKKLKRKMDFYLLPLMWLCYGIQQADKTGLSAQTPLTFTTNPERLAGTMATFGLREDTGLVGQQYSWLTTVFYLTYMCFEFPSNILLQRWRMGKTLSIYMICWGVVVLCIGFAKNFKHLIALRAMQGFFECCISPGFILIIGSWYTRREHSSRSLVFQSANAGFGTLEYNGEDIQAWRYMSYFLGSLTVAVGLLCLYFLGTPSEVPWLTKEEKRMANTRILENQSGHDRTGTKCGSGTKLGSVWSIHVNKRLSVVPNGGLTTFGSLINTSFGFTSLQVILYTIPRSMTSVVVFVIVGLVTSKWKNLRLYIMAFATIPPFIGFLGMALIETSVSTKWTKWGMYYMTVPFVLSLFLGWTLIPSNLPGRTKRTVTSSFTFVGYCVGNMCGSQIFKTKDAPTYTPGVMGCSICFGLEFLVIVAWRTTLVLRNRCRDKAMLTDGLTEEEREMQGKINGESDMTDFENPHFRYTL
ncbi:major facilitator superfamily transporter [Desarmillaria tabescens]|uniref:Major facilitator superfamily transporter n=1 Tax=Armillaria tabescens TaxID=1929756 RepID=A0AA39MIU4_ARMTA|nr:major facilitator superfamily transporter [Desarmillaria tabescens]KAK0435947.1 major facilitator superfamily transporter [Desarmillaria tabescens]